MKKKNKKIIKIIGIILAIAFLASIIYIISLPKEKPFISITYYDANGNKVNSQQSLAVYNIPYSSKVVSMAITLHIQNNGAISLSCYPNIVTPVELNNSLPKTVKGVKPGQSIEWTSSQMELSQFIGKTQPIRFNISIRCQFYNGTSQNYLVKSGFIDLNIHSVCGDNICQSDETCDLCGIDCCPHFDYAKFRTSNLTYPRTQAVYAIAYSGTCGDNLVKYDFNSAIPGTICYGTTASLCPPSIGTLLLDQTANIPGRPKWAGSNIGCLYQDLTYPNILILAWKVAISSGSPCATVGNWGAIRYEKNDASSLISDTPYSLIPSNEVMCS
jgi:hypothetical protein